MSLNVRHAFSTPTPQIHIFLVSNSSPTPFYIHSKSQALAQLHKTRSKDSRLAEEGCSEKWQGAHPTRHPSPGIQHRRFRRSVAVDDSKSGCDIMFEDWFVPRILEAPYITADLSALVYRFRIQKLWQDILRWDVFEFKGVILHKDSRSLNGSGTRLQGHLCRNQDSMVQMQKVNAATPQMRNQKGTRDLMHRTHTMKFLQILGTQSNHFAKFEQESHSRTQVSTFLPGPSFTAKAKPRSPHLLSEIPILNFIEIPDRIPISITDEA
jgi:hypothetical protein